MNDEDKKLIELYVKEDIASSRREMMKELYGEIEKLKEKLQDLKTDVRINSEYVGGLKKVVYVLATMAITSVGAHLFKGVN